jgi:hypothetical protein
MNTIKKSGSPAPQRAMNMIPSNPEEFQSSWPIINHVVTTNINDVGMIYAKNTRVAEWMLWGRRSGIENHDVTMLSAGMHYVFVASNIICCIIQPHDAVPENAILLEKYSMPVAGRVYACIGARSCRRGYVWTGGNLFCSEERLDAR